MVWWWCGGTNLKKKKMNPARARRSRLRLEEFKAKKFDQREIDSPTVGDSAVEQNERDKKMDANRELKEASISTKMLVLELAKAKDIPVTKELASPILQVDGAEKLPSGNSVFNFHSEFGEEDIMYSFSEIFPEDIVTSYTLLSRDRVGRTADHNCTVELKLAAGQTRDISWPKMPPWHADVFSRIKRIQ